MNAAPPLSNHAQSTAAAAEDFQCATCKSPAHVTIESIQALEPQVDGWVAAEYSCGACETFYAHDVAVIQLAKFLATTDAPAGVLKFGRQYIHCGEPMPEQEMALAGIAAATDDQLAEVILPTVVLRCRCGFQMGIPC